MLTACTILLWGFHSAGSEAGPKSTKKRKISWANNAKSLHEGDDDVHDKRLWF